VVTQLLRRIVQSGDSAGETGLFSICEDRFAAEGLDLAIQAEQGEQLARRLEWDKQRSP
jgi:hypothetical protein